MTHQKIVEKAFEKNQRRIKDTEGVTLSKTQNADSLAETLQSEYKVIFGGKSLRDVCNGKRQITKPNVLEALCNFLGYESYKNCINQIDPKSNNTDDDGFAAQLPKSIFFLEKGFAKMRVMFTNFSKKQRIILVVFIFCLILYISFFRVKRQRFMVWKEDHYEVVDFDPKKYKLSQLKLYKEERITKFKKIQEVTCEYEYFNKKGQAKVWYGKNYKGELELFTSIGLHPETGKSLKPITKYMIKKYICSDY